MQVCNKFSSILKFGTKGGCPEFESQAVHQYAPLTQMDRVTVFETVSYKFETCMEYHAQLVLGTKSKAELFQKYPPNGR